MPSWILRFIRLGPVPYHSERLVRRKRSHITFDGSTVLRHIVSLDRGAPCSRRTVSRSNDTIAAIRGCGQRFTRRFLRALSADGSPSECHGCVKELGFVAPRKHSKEPFGRAVTELIDDHGDNDDAADDDVSVGVGDRQLVTTAAYHRDDQCTDDRAEDRPAPAAQAAAPEHNRGNDLEFLAGARRSGCRS